MDTRVGLGRAGVGWHGLSGASGLGLECAGAGVCWGRSGLEWAWAGLAWAGVGWAGAGCARMGWGGWHGRVLMNTAYYLSFPTNFRV